jgi:hypothetical protein
MEFIKDRIFSTIISKIILYSIKFIIKDYRRYLKKVTNIKHIILEKNILKIY